MYFNDKELLKITFNSSCKLLRNLPEPEITFAKLFLNDS